MGERCRVCGRELLGNQRRWLFHPAAKVSLQALLSHALAREVLRDGRGEFACGKCAFLLGRVYRFDTVIARVEALSLERLHKLLLEKGRLKACIAGMYRKTNGEEPARAASPDARYAALLQEDFAYSGFECWTEPEAPPSHAAGDEAGCRARRCRSCAALRVGDADYEAICRIPRKVARGVSCAPSSRGTNASLCNEDAAPGGKEEGELLMMEEQETPGSSLESLEEAGKGGKGGWGAGEQHGLDVALSLIKTFDCKPVQSPRGSKLPVPAKLSPPCQDAADKSASPAFQSLAAKSPSGSAFAFPSDMPDLQELWEDLYADYMPLRIKNLCEDRQQPTRCDSSLGEQAAERNNAELLEKISHLSATNKELQDKLNEVDFELNAVQHASRRQDHNIRNLSESLKSRESESEELYHFIEEQNETIAKLQDMLHSSQLGQLQILGESSLPRQKQQIALLEVQNTLFFTHLEVQQLKRTRQQKERHLAETQRTVQLLEASLQEEQHQKDEAWKHNRELRSALQQFQAELQSKNWQCCSLEREKCLEVQRREQQMDHLRHSLACKEQLLQESKELIQFHHPNLDKNTTSLENMVQKLQQRIKDRDATLEHAVDEKFRLLEEKEREAQHLRLSVRERERDLEQLRTVLSGNEASVQSLEGLLRAKDLELERLSSTCQNLQWLKQETEAKSRSWQAEQEETIQQLQSTLHDRNKEVEALSATLLCKVRPEQRDVVEEMFLRLQQKEQVLQKLLSDKNQQALQQENELQDLLKAVSTREQQRQVASEKMAQALAERSCELQFLRQQLIGRAPQADSCRGAFLQNDQPAEALRQGSSCESTDAMICREERSRCTLGKDVLETTVGLEKQLLDAKEELQLLLRKERESRLELSALQSVVAAQEEKLQVQASEAESLTRSIQIKEELIKDLQVQLVDPEEMPAMERLTQEVLMLQEKVARMESPGQEAAEDRKLQLLQMLEGLAAEKKQLSETLQAEKQLYSTLVKLCTHPDSAGQEKTLQVELERIRALSGQLEEALGRSLEHLSRLESLDGFGGGEQERVRVLPKHAF